MLQVRNSLQRSCGIVFRRNITATCVLLHNSSDTSSQSPEESITVNWKNKNGEVKITKAKIGSSLLQVAHREEIDLEGSVKFDFSLSLTPTLGACGGVCACSTCHVILEPSIYDNLPEPSEEEEDMLDLAFGLTSTSRLGCQVILDKSHDGMTIQLPAATRNFYVDGHVPKPH